jgi:hypothetical protein
VAPLRYWLQNLRHRLRGWREEIKHVAKLGLRAELRVSVLKASGQRVDYGVVSRRKITDAGVAKMADAMLNLFEPEIFNYHAAGTGVGVEAAADTTLGTEVSARVAGTQSKPSAPVYQTVGVWLPAATFAVTEHGVFSQLAAGGTLLDRSVFAAINVVNGDSITFTYQLTFPSGG